MFGWAAGAPVQEVGAGVAGAAVEAAFRVAADHQEAEAQVAAGKKDESSPIVEAIAEAESRTSGEIRVHLTRRRFERDPFQRAWKLFHQYGMTRTAQRNAVLFYLNLRKKKFAIVGDEGIHRVVGAHYWEELAKSLREDLLSTHIENAVALAVRTIGVTLERFFPHDPNSANHNELVDEVTKD
jgi:uncharacterized membrane protein